ncbi:hypothetical protein Vadar_003146 [Vaccinium darrowii]|uniref:Uncharacterized protein n=1 Tax=Vaccinium darrowii TaxID=229202 RepID=A0ACB7WXK2_9ERIC|nr:hypothetical protein Vadar_003146 [Vaccinium darrowii]
MVDATITAIKGSFERSLSTLQHSYKIRIFNNLVGVVSQDAMRYMKMELKKIDSINMECTTPCMCPLRHTHGLPCAHEIAPFKNKEEQLPLSLIHEHWKKLSFDKPKKDPTIMETMKANFDIFMERFFTFDEDHQRHIMRKMMEVIYPHSTSLTKPKVKAKVRGRPKSNNVAQSIAMSMLKNKTTKSENSTCGDPSLFEYVESELKTKVVEEIPISTPKSEVVEQKPKASPTIPKPKVVKQTPHRKKSQLQCPVIDSKYIMQLPEGIRMYISGVKDVEADGNCGFHAIAALAGYDKNDWKAIRQIMLLELTSYASLYENVSGGKERLDELRHRLDYFGDGPAPNDKWLTMPDMGHIVASAFKVALVFLSEKQCLTFLPLHCTPLPPKCLLKNNVSSMGYINNNHFIQVYLRNMLAILLIKM